MKNKNFTKLFFIGAVAAFVAALLHKKENMTDSEKIEVALAQVFKNEGGYVNNPGDIGGETKYGISKRAYPQENIKELTKERAKELYMRDYVQPLKNQLFGQPLNNVYQIIDSAVNCGVSRTKKLLEQVNLVNDFQQVRRNFYYSIATGAKQQFLKGWLKRVDVKL